MGHTIPENDETVTLTISSNAAYTVGSARSATVTITDDDRKTVTIVATDNVAAEAGANTGTFRVTRTGSRASALTVYYTISGTATNGTDYNALPGTVIIPAGWNYVDITVTPVNDMNYEGDETVTLTISANATYTVGTPSSATVTIGDNDFSVMISATDGTAAEAGANTGTFRVTRTESTASALTAYYTRSGTATNGADYNALPGSVVIPAGASSADITLTPVNDTDYEGDETVVLTLSANPTYTVGSASSATVTITDNDSASILSDNFEDGTAFDWLKNIVGYSSPTAQIVAVTDYVYEGTYAGRFTNFETGGSGTEGPGKYSPVYKKFAPQTGIFTIEISAMSDGPGGDKYLRGFGFSDQDPVINFSDVYNRIDAEKYIVGGIVYGNGYQLLAISNCAWIFGNCQPTQKVFTRTKWDRFKLVVNVSDQNYEVYVNDEYVLTAPFRRTVSQLSHFMIFSEYVNLYVDNIMIKGAYTSIQQPQIQDYFPLNNGDTWQYNNGESATSTLITFPPYLQGDIYRLTRVHAGGAWTHSNFFRYDDNRNLICFGGIWPDGDFFVYNTPVTYPSTVELGRTYRLYSERAEYDRNHNLLGHGSDTLDIVVTGPETITTGAGVFETYKMTETDYWTNSQGYSGTSTEVYWLAKNIGIVKKQEFDGSLFVLQSAVVNGNYY